MKIVTIGLLLLSLTACSTVVGVGKDIQSTAEWTKEKIGGR
jgi:predicted small secreted protein